MTYLILLRAKDEFMSLNNGVIGQYRTEIVLCTLGRNVSNTKHAKQGCCYDIVP